MNASLSFESPAGEDVLQLLSAGERFAAALYPPESNHFLPVETLRSPDIRFLVARDPSGAAVGTGAVVLADGWAEVKRMWVSPAARRQGICAAILTALEQCAFANGVRTIMLETGIYNEAALAFYARAGFTRCEPFADYLPDPYSVFMQKVLAFPARDLADSEPSCGAG